MSFLDRRDCLKAGVAAFGAAALDGVAPASPDDPEVVCRYDHILGTSLDLLFRGPAGSVSAAERAVLDEIERLRRVFSLHDPDSELSRLNQATGTVLASADLRAVLRVYERWQPLSGWACNAQVGALARLWAGAERAGTPPGAEALTALSAEIARPGWRIDDTLGTVTRLTSHPLDLNAAAKGYILTRAATAAREAAPGLTAALLNLGGDLIAWGAAWPVAIQDPARPADNDRPLGGLLLRDGAVATSGGYQRFYTFADSRHSHLLDPRSGRPADRLASATVTAADSTTANVLATTLCVLGPEEGLRLVATLPRVECLLVAPGGRTWASPGFPLLPVVPARQVVVADEPKGTTWPGGFAVTLSVRLPQQGGGKYRRPYVAIWMEDADGKAVRTLAVWGNSPKYLKDLSDWWKIGRGKTDLIRAVTRATRGPGKYELTWDGKDDSGKPLPQGTYTVRVEVHREHGKHLRQTGKIDCKDAAATLKLEKNAETEETVVEYAARKSP